MQPNRRDSDPHIHIATDDDMQEERREGSPGRRATDQPPSGSWGPDWKLWLQVAGFVLVIATTIFTTGRNVAATEQAVKEVAALKQQLEGIDAKLAKAALEGNSQSEKQQFLERQFDEFKRDQKAESDLQDTLIANTRERVGKLEVLTAK